jgi:tRNA threonylcarbamoyladenosine modification (KEOPS) complex  Pcc1 subunit
MLITMSKEQIHTCELKFEFSSEQEAQLVADAVKLDNPEFITLEVKGKTLKSKISAPTISSLLHSLDDYLACISLAEKITQDSK